MSFEPVVPLSGLSGWAFLNRTAAAQTAAFERRPDIARDEAYFRSRIASVTTAEQLVSDRRLLRISLEAFGLDDDVNAKAFVRKVLEGGTENGQSLANRLTNPLYARFAAAFGFGNASGARTGTEGFAESILTRWRELRFEKAVGAQNNDMRLALNARREIASIATSGSSETTKWFRILGSPPLRKVIQGALGLPSSFASLDIDRQVVELDRRLSSITGKSGVSQLSQSDKLENLIKRFLTTTQISGMGQSNPAVVLLQSSRLFQRF